MPQYLDVNKYWKTDDAQRLLIKQKIAECIDHIKKEDDGNCDLTMIGMDFTREPFSAMDVKHVLEEELGYQEADWSENGWQHDFWITLKHPDVDKIDLMIQGTGVLGTLFLTGVIE